MKIYLDTSVINGLYADDAPWIKNATKLFFKSVQSEGHSLFISQIVSEEIKRTPDLSKQKKLLHVIQKYQCKELRNTEKSIELATKYIKHKIIP